MSGDGCHLLTRGAVSVDGQLARGRNAAIVSHELFDQVQNVLNERSQRATAMGYWSTP